MMCDILQCPPSYIKRLYPELTIRDKIFLINAGWAKLNAMAQALGFANRPNTFSKNR
jgi:hypothetical protein